MVQRYFEGKIVAKPGVSASEPDQAFQEADRYICGRFTSPEWGLPGGLRPHLVGQLIEELKFNRALEEIWGAIDTVNSYIVASSPFTLAKDAAQMPRVAQILANLVEGLRVIADTLDPFMPRTSAKILELLNVNAEMAGAPFGKGIQQGHRVKPTTPLFPRIDKTARS